MCWKLELSDFIRKYLFFSFVSPGNMIVFRVKSRLQEYIQVSFSCQYCTGNWVLIYIFAISLDNYNPVFRSETVLLSVWTKPESMYKVIMTFFVYQLTGPALRSHRALTGFPHACGGLVSCSMTFCFIRLRGTRFGPGVQ